MTCACLQAIPAHDFAAQSAFKTELRQGFHEYMPDVLQNFYDSPDVAACLADTQVSSFAHAAMTL